MMNRSATSSSSLTLAVLACTLLAADGCSRVLHKTQSGDVYVARTFDWEITFHTNMIYYPKGRPMDGGCGDQDRALCKTWTSKYYSLATTANDKASLEPSNFTGKNFSWVEDGVIDGVNEKGFAVHTLFLGSSTYPTYKPVKNATTWWRWQRYLLDMCASVDEAIEVMQNDEIVVAGVAMGGNVITLHMAVDDASGNSAIFEMINGSVRIYSKENKLERDLAILTNDPEFQSQLEFRDALIRYRDYPKSMTLKCDEMGGPRYPGNYPNRCLPGDVTAIDRFTRLSWFHGHLKDVYANGTEKGADDMLGDVRSVLLTAAVPQGAPDSDPWDSSVYPTWWYSAYDFQRKLYFWQFYRYSSMVWVDLAEIGKNTEVKVLKAIDHPDWHGDATKAFADVTKFFEAVPPEYAQTSLSQGEQRIRQHANLRQHTSKGASDDGDSSDTVFVQTEVKIDL